MTLMASQREPSSRSRSHTLAGGINITDSARSTSVLSTRSGNTAPVSLVILDLLTNESGDGLEEFNATFESLHGAPKSPGPNCARCLCLSHPLLDHRQDRLWNTLRDLFDQSKTRDEHLLTPLAMLEFPVYSLQAKCAWPMWFSGPASRKPD